MRESFPRRSTLWLIAFNCLVVAAHHGAFADDVIRSGGIEFAFATAEQGQQLVGQRDRFVDQLSPFDRQARMGSDRDAGNDAFLRFAAAEVIDWPATDRQAVAGALEELDAPLARFKLPTIGRVTLVHTTGREESGAAYTRGTMIVLPRGQTGSKGRSLSRLLAHELFHLLSRSNPALRDRLYSIIGFRPVGEIPLPASLADQRITNPDAPVVEHVIDIRLDETKTVAVAPVLFAATAFRPQQNRSLFRYLQFRLMEVRPAPPQGWRAVLVDGQPVLHEASVPDFHRQIGSNTGYIIHPEEILADNFAALVTGAEVNDAWLTEAIAQTLE